MDKRKKYVAVIMNRIYSKDGDFLYVASHPEIGYLDKNNKIFRDRNGNEYLPLLDTSLMMSEISNAYYGAIELDKLCEKTETYPLRKAISNYAYGASKNVYYVSALEDNIPFVIPLDLTHYKEDLREAFDQAMNKDSDNESKDPVDYVEGDYKPAHAMEDEKEKSEDVSIEKDNIPNIILKMINGDYTLAELKEISNVFKNRKDEIEGLLESIAVQIESSENGESKNEIKDFDKEKGPVLLPNKYINIDKLYDKITQTLIAQDKPLRRVIVELIRKIQHPEERKKAILLTGSTGVGKTKMMSLIAKNIDRPFIKVNSTELTIPGYVGTDIEEVLWDLYVASGKDKEKTENAIVFFDEIDKKGSDKKDDVSGKGVLNTLLPFVEGNTYTACEDTKKAGTNVKIDTTNMTVVFGGAFNDVYKELSKASNSMGFGTDISQNNTDLPVNVDDFIKKAGMPDELMGRISTIVKLNDLDVESLRRILLESDESAIKRQEQHFEELGVKLTPGYDYINALAEQALERKAGARGIDGVVDDTTWAAYDDAYSNLGKYSEIILGEETVNDPYQYKKVLRKRVNK